MQSSEVGKLRVVRCVWARDKTTMTRICVRIVKPKEKHDTSASVDVDDGTLSKMAPPRCSSRKKSRAASVGTAGGSP